MPMISGLRFFSMHHYIAYSFNWTTIHKVTVKRFPTLRCTAISIRTVAVALWKERPYCGGGIGLYLSSIIPSRQLVKKTSLKFSSFFESGACCTKVLTHLTSSPEKVNPSKTYAYMPARHVTFPLYNELHRRLFRRNERFVQTWNRKRGRTH